MVRCTLGEKKNSELHNDQRVYRVPDVLARTCAYIELPLRTVRKAFFIRLIRRVIVAVLLIGRCATRRLVVDEKIFAVRLDL